MTMYDFFYFSSRDTYCIKYLEFKKILHIVNDIMGKVVVVIIIKDKEFIYKCLELLFLFWLIGLELLSNLVLEDNVFKYKFDKWIKITTWEHIYYMLQNIYYFYCFNNNIFEVQKKYLIQCKNI